MLTVLAITLLLCLAVYLFVTHKDLRASSASVLIAVLVAAGSYRKSSREEALERQLEESRRRITTLEATPAKRGFTPEARERMTERLAELVGPTAFVLANASDLETTEYAREIVSILKEAGWEVPPSFGMTYRPVILPGYEGVPKGVIFGVSPEVPETFAASVFAIFREGGVEIVRGPHWPGTEHPISILVGPKRVP